jgi:diacylglycerol kinase (ATP)
MRIGVVFNPRSGIRQGRRIYRMTKAAIIGSGHTPVFVHVERGRSIEKLLADVSDEIDAVAAIGGDGTLNGVVNGIMDSSRPDMPVAFFPAGRGKDVARSLPSFSLDRLGTYQIDWTATQLVDVAQADLNDGTHRFFMNVSNVGLSAEAARVAAKLPRQIGTTSYMLGAVKAFLSCRPQPVRFLLDDSVEMELDNVLLLAVCNGRSFGGGLYIAPEAEQDDGLLDLVAIRNANLLDLGLNLPNLRRSTPFGHPAITRWRARSISVEAGSLAPIDLDGDMWGSLPVTYTIKPAALNWIGPQP